MLRIALALALGFAAVTIAGTSVSLRAQDKKDVKTVEGKLVCAKCTLEETKACTNAVKVKEGDKTVVYFLKDKGTKEKYHKEICPGGTEVDVKVTGKVVEKDKKKYIEEPKVEIKK